MEKIMKISVSVGQRHIDAAEKEAGAIFLAHNANMTIRDRDVMKDNLAQAFADFEAKLCNETSPENSPLIKMTGRSFLNNVLSRKGEVPRGY